MSGASTDAVTLRPMTRALCHELFRGWENDPAIYADPAECRPYRYDESAVDRYFDAKQEPSRVLLAVMLRGRVIGEVQLKRIDRARGECTLSIHLQNDAVKGRGCGMLAERLALRHAFDVLGMNAVNADTVSSNMRSRHILEKLGFRFLREEDGFRYYRIERGDAT
ncbi:MAG: GNAT family N-acetyltransferase [Ruminococcaceae bacterium]|nr:GNAT family N-acetyltransferase [Oscillospiraceae bacterium]